jgi:L-ribulokinase
VVEYPSSTAVTIISARQNPADYPFGLEKSVRGAIEQAKAAGFSTDILVGIGTLRVEPMPVDAGNRALALDPKIGERPQCPVLAVEDRTSHEEAATITGWRRSIVLSRSRNAVTPTHPNGFGPRSGVA